MNASFWVVAIAVHSTCTPMGADRELCYVVYPACTLASHHKAVSHPPECKENNLVYYLKS